MNLTYLAVDIRYLSVLQDCICEELVNILNDNTQESNKLSIEELKTQARIKNYCVWVIFNIIESNTIFHEAFLELSVLKAFKNVITAYCSSGDNSEEFVSLETNIFETISLFTPSLAHDYWYEMTDLIRKIGKFLLKTVSFSNIIFRFIQDSKIQGY